MARAAAATSLAAWYRVHPPFEIASKETVQAQVDSVLREPSGSYEVRWTETTRNLNGDVLSTTHWRALLAVQLVPPDPDHLLTNPIGLYVTQIDWSEEQGS
jgi:type IV secretion system protein VirB5